MEAAHALALTITVLLAIIGWMGRVLYNDLAEDVKQTKKDINYLYSWLRTPEGEDSAPKRRKF